MTSQTKTAELEASQTQQDRKDRRVSFWVAVVDAVSACFTNWVLADLITELLG